MRFGLVSRIRNFSDKILTRRLELWQEHLPRNEAFSVRDNPEIRKRLRQIKPGDRGEIEQTGPSLQNLAFGNLWDLFFAFARANNGQTDAGYRNAESGVRNVETDRKSSMPDARVAGEPEIVTPHSALGTPHSALHTPNSEFRNRESGRPLGGLLRHRMERKVGMNLANVRIHTNAETARQLRRAGADALTVGDQVYFAPGKYDPESRRGRALLVHELTHVRQQQEIADSGARLSPTRMQHFEQQAQHNERETLQRSDNLPLAGDPAIGSHAPAPVLFNPAMYGLAQNRSGGATGQNIQNAPPAMAAASDRNLDTGPVGVPLAAETALSEQDAFAETATRTEEIYDALKWQLKIERERSGD